MAPLYEPRAGLDKGFDCVIVGHGGRAGELADNVDSKLPRTIVELELLGIQGPKVNLTVWDPP